MHGETERFLHEGGLTREIAYQIEAERGYASRGLLWSPGRFAATLKPGARCHARRLDRAVAHRARARHPTEAFAADAERRRRLLAIAHPSRADRAGRGARARQRISSS